MELSRNPRSATSPPPGAAPEVALDVREAAVDVVDGALEDVDDERRGLLYVDVVEGWADAADASLVRDVVVKTVADGPWCPQGAHKAKEHKRQHRPRPRSEDPRRVPGEDEGANAAAADYGAVVITHRHGYARPGPRAAVSTRQVPGGGGGTTKPPRPASPLLGTRRRVTAPARAPARRSAALPRGAPSTTAPRRFPRGAAEEEGGEETLRLERDTNLTRCARLSAAAYFVFFCFSIIICLTIFCSSMRKARTTRCRTHLAQRLPPYARETVRSRLCVFL